MFEQKSECIYHLKIPFEDIYTSAFLVNFENGRILIDCGTVSSDVNEVILPALNKEGLSLSDVSFLMLTHKHGDHCGGMRRVLEINPDIKIIDSVSEISCDVEVYPLPGHTKDCIGLLHIASGTLITGDGLQGSDVGRYKCYFECSNEYLSTLKRLQSDKRVKNLLLSHAYNPWKRNDFFGRDNVLKVISDCYKILEKYRTE